jgi:hypothetical protein
MTAQMHGRRKSRMQPMGTDLFTTGPAWSLSLIDWRELFIKQKLVLLKGHVRVCVVPCDLGLTRCHLTRNLTTNGCQFAHFCFNKWNYCPLIQRGCAQWNRVLLDKLIAAQLIKKFLAFFGSRRFITIRTNARLRSLSWASWIWSKPSHTIFLLDQF